MFQQVQNRWLLAVSLTRQALLSQNPPLIFSLNYYWFRQLQRILPSQAFHESKKGITNALTCTPWIRMSHKSTNNYPDRKKEKESIEKKGNFKTNDIAGNEDSTVSLKEASSQQRHTHLNEKYLRKPDKNKKDTERRKSQHCERNKYWDDTLEFNQHGVTEKSGGKIISCGHIESCEKTEVKGTANEVGFELKGAPRQSHSWSDVKKKYYRPISTHEDKEPRQTPSSSLRKSNKRWKKLHQPARELTKTARCWHQLKQAPSDRQGMVLSLMSYNILAQDLMENHPDLYSRCRDRDLLWQHRGAAILRQIISHDADIVCLQEVQADHWRFDMQPVLKAKGYSGIYKQRNGDKPDGCAILYKRSKFNLLKVVPVQFFQGGIMDRDNVGIILLLQPHHRFYSGSAKKICVATTHLLFNPKRGDIKLAQLIMFLAEIDKVAAMEERMDVKRKRKAKIAHEHESGNPVPTNVHPESKDPSHLGDDEMDEASANTSGACGVSAQNFEHNSGETHIPNEAPASQSYCPIILCGDFNTEPFCNMYDFITRGHLKYEGLIGRYICGQAEGKERGSNSPLGRNLLPAHLAISESCQYIQVLRDRHRARSTNSRSDNDSRSQSKIKISRWDDPNPRKGCDKSQTAPIINETNQEKDLPFVEPKTNSGLVHHTMGFQSVFPHVTEVSGPHGKRLMEVSSQHARCSCTVDYIFYSSSLIQADQAQHIPGFFTSDATKASNVTSSGGGSPHDKFNHRAEETTYWGSDATSDGWANPVSDKHRLNNNNEPELVAPPDSKSQGQQLTAPKQHGSGTDRVDSCSHGSVSNISKGEVVEDRERQLELLARYSLLTAEEIARTGYLPNATFPSDHLCLIAKFYLR